MQEELGFDAVLKVGIEYAIVHGFLLRTGIQPSIKQTAFGIGFQAKRFLIDYAFLPSIYLGHSHQLSMIYRLPK